MPSALPYICLGCKRFTGNTESDTCEAFPKGIPWPITAGLTDHAVPIEGDGGKTFLEDPEKHDIVVTFYDWVNSPEGTIWLHEVTVAAGDEGLDYIS